MRLIQGDCLEVMPKLIEEGIKVDLVLTDLPYGTTGCKWDTIIPFEVMWDYCSKISYETTPYLFFGFEPFTSKLITSNINHFKYNWIWHKNTATGFPFAKYQPLRNYEVISVFYRRHPTYNPIKEKRDASKESMQRYKYPLTGGRKGEVYDEFTPQKHYCDPNSCLPKLIKKFNTVPACNRYHSSQKPLELLEYLIKTYTNEEDLVLDFTMGSGSTGVACLQTNRNFIGIKKEQKYYDIAVERCKEYQTKLI